MSGAVCLAGLGALRGGAGLVYLAVPRSICSNVAAIEPSYLTIPLDEDELGCVSLEAQLQLTELIPASTAIAIGPGCGLSGDLIALMQWMYTTVERPLVIDADGLNALAQHSQVLTEHAAPRILTPHPGEFSRLTNKGTKTIQAHREELAVEFAERWQAVLLLKGHRTIVTDGQRLAINLTGNSGMATGGSGDVLTGLIAALLAQGLEPFAAAQLAAHLHGLAGDLAAEDMSRPGLIASDLPRYLTNAWKQLGQ